MTGSSAGGPPNNRLERPGYAGRSACAFGNGVTSRSLSPHARLAQWTSRSLARSAIETIAIGRGDPTTAAIAATVWRRSLAETQGSGKGAPSGRYGP